MNKPIDLDHARTIGLMIQAASLLELDAIDMDCPPDRDQSQRTRIAQINRALAQAIRNHVTIIGG